ncbi:MAG: hypothetical protein V1933_08330 [Candidatus Omnitrophota bacterium]
MKYIKISLVILLILIIFSSIFYGKVTKLLKDVESYNSRELNVVNGICYFEGKPNPFVVIGNKGYNLNDYIGGGQIIDISFDEFKIKFSSREQSYRVGDVIGVVGIHSKIYEYFKMIGNNKLGKKTKNEEVSKVEHRTSPEYYEKAVSNYVEARRGYGDAKTKLQLYEKTLKYAQYSYGNESLNVLQRNEIVSIIEDSRTEISNNTEEIETAERYKKEDAEKKTDKKADFEPVINTIETQKVERRGGEGQATGTWTLYPPSAE